MSGKQRKPSKKAVPRKPIKASKLAKAAAPAPSSARAPEGALRPHRSDTSAASHVQTLALLWGPQGREGRSGLSVRAIVDAAVELADKKGLAAVSMRQIADTLGVGTMSIYTHVPGRAELTALMFDNVLGQLYSDLEEPSREPGWRAALELVAQRNWLVFTRHPWMLGLYASRPSNGPQAMLKFEAELRAVDGIGLDDVEMDSVLGLVITHVAGTAQVRADLRRVREESGISDAEWWEQTEPVLLNLMGGRQQFPVAWRVGQAAGETHQASADPEHMLRFGLARILDGVAQLVEARGSAGKRTTKARGTTGKRTTKARDSAGKSGRKASPPGRARKRPGLRTT